MRSFCWLNALAMECTENLYDEINLIFGSEITWSKSSEWHELYRFVSSLWVLPKKYYPLKCNGFYLATWHHHLAEMMKSETNAVLIEFKLFLSSSRQFDECHWILCKQNWKLCIILRHCLTCNIEKDSNHIGIQHSTDKKQRASVNGRPYLPSILSILDMFKCRSSCIDWAVIIYFIDLNRIFVGRCKIPLPWIELQGNFQFGLFLFGVKLRSGPSFLCN